MFQKVPYHSSLTVGNIISSTLMSYFEKINQSLRKIDKAKEKLESLMTSHREINMMQRQIKSLGIEISTRSLDQYKEAIQKMIEEACHIYIETKISSDIEIQSLELEEDKILFQESPIDYEYTKYQFFPWSADSLKLDYQYFSFKNNDEVSNINNIKSFLNTSVQDLPNTNENVKITQAAFTSFQNRYENLNIEGTLIMSAVCTHKNVMILEPLSLDIRRAITVWNETYITDKINIQDEIDSKITQTNNKLHIISGAIYGSCFIGMVHFVKKQNNSIQNTQNQEEILKKIRKKN